MIRRGDWNAKAGERFVLEELEIHTTLVIRAIYNPSSLRAKESIASINWRHYLGFRCHNPRTVLLSFDGPGRKLDRNYLRIRSNVSNGISRLLHQAQVADT